MKWLDKLLGRDKKFSGMDFKDFNGTAVKPDKISTPLSRMFNKAKDSYYASQPAPKRPKIKGSRFQARHWVLKDGYAYNPLQKWPVNMPCWCGSKIKAKKCCKPFIPHAITIELHNTINFLWEDLMLGKTTLPGIPRNKVKVETT